MPQHPSPPSPEAFAPSNSPAPELTIALPGVPEVVPGQNAFALQLARMERHRLDGNAFYQKELQKRTISPPTGSHPAVRDQSPHLHHDPSRDSQMTAMSPFINAGKPPPCKLIPSPSMTMGNGAPTRRGYIEERTEHNAHIRSGSQVERTPVYTYTPKQGGGEFEMSKTAGFPPKSPKKSVLDLFRKSTRSNSSSPLTPPSTSTTSVIGLETSMKVPPKAKAMLGSPPKPAVARSPSKRKAFFSRKNANLPELNMIKLSSARSGPSSKSSASDQPLSPSPITSNQRRPSFSGHSATTSASHRDNESFPATSTLPEQRVKLETPLNKPVINRSQGLKYMDRAPPPTPPSKDTPPDQRSKEKSSCKSFEAMRAQQEITPSKGANCVGLISASGRLSPTKSGNYAHRETPRLVTRPSVYSMHASVVPEMVEIGAFEEMKGRIDGLGLEGFTLPGENIYNASPAFVYSPSVYNGEFESRPVGVTRTPRHGNRYSVDNLPTVIEHPFGSKPISLHHANESSSTSGTIPVIFRPNDIHYHIPSFGSSQDENLPNDGNSLSSHDGNVFHDSQGHNNSQLSARSSDVRKPSNGSLFAIPINESTRLPEPMSPPMYNNPSAMPSPLQCLPSTAYAPLTSKPGQLAHQTMSNETQSRSTENLERDLSLYPSRTANILDPAPALQAPGSDGLLSRQNTDHKMNYPAECLPNAIDGASGVEVDTSDPKKQLPATMNSISVGKIDQVIEMLSTMNTRNNDVAAFRDEFKATNSRLDKRLAAIESLQRDSPPAPIGSTVRRERNPELPPTPCRIPTMFAHEFYRQHNTSSDIYFSNPAMQVPQDSPTPVINAPKTRPAKPMHLQISRNSPLAPPSTHAGSNSELSPSDVESQTVVRLEETNRQLMDMVRDLTKKMNEMEKRIGNREQNES